MAKNKLTIAQKREYELLKKNGSVYVAGLQRMNVFSKLVEKGLAEKDGSWHWYHIKQ